MEIEEAIATLENLIRGIGQTEPRGTGIRAENVKGLRIENCEFIRLKYALDVSNSQDIIFKNNLVNNYDSYSELPGLIEQFLYEVHKKGNKSNLVKIKDQIMNRWPEILGTSIAIAIIRLTSG